MKKVIFLLLVVLIIPLITSCDKDKTIPKPEDGDFEFWITDDVTDYDWTGHDSIDGWFGASEYLDKRYNSIRDEESNMNLKPEFYVSYVITSYPDYASTTKAVTSIDITDPSITIYGLSVNSSREEINKKMNELGLKSLEETFRYQKGNIIISFLVGRILIRAEVTNEKGIVF